MEALVCLPLFYLRPGAASLHDLNTIHSTNEKFTPNIHYAYERTLCGVDFSNNIWSAKSPPSEVSIPN